MAFWDFVRRVLGLQVETADPPAPMEAPPPPITAPKEEAVRPAPTSPIPAPAPIASGPPPATTVSTTPVASSPTSAIPAAFLPTDFLPIERAQQLKEGEEARRAGWMWFGRRDMIPPASDARTMLIDRGMLTQGFVTAEDLAEMHRIGDEWSKHANRMDHINIQAGRSAEEAVEADRAARAARKAQKKAEAAERQKQHAEGVIQRKTTDIQFVGRGVSALMGDRASDAAKLQAAGLPLMHAPADLATALSLSIPKLRWLCFHTPTATRIHYVQFEVPKKSGGTRTLSAPHRTMAAAQQWVLDNILAKLPVEESAHGFVAGRSILTNAKPHVARDVVVNLDLEAFFPSIGFARVRNLFRRLGYSGAVATLLALLCTECPRKRVVYAGTPYFVATGPRGLPQGACTSPALSNQIAKRLDRRLSGIATKLGLVYTRYADDLTFSAGPGFRDRVAYLLARVRHIADDEGFRVNPKKTRVQRPNARQTVTGLVVNVKPAVPRSMVRRIRAMLHRAKTEGLAAQNREAHPNFAGWIEGMIAFISMAQPETGGKLRKQLDELAS